VLKDGRDCLSSPAMQGRDVGHCLRRMKNNE
jgi:hypothetical protein